MHGCTFVTSEQQRTDLTEHRAEHRARLASERTRSMTRQPEQKWEHSAMAAKTEVEDMGDGSGIN